MRIPFFTQGRKDTSRLIAVGDIHGCLDSLRRLMAKIRPNASDRLVFLGDYVDRGPDSRGVIEFLIDFKNRFPRTVFLKGNHEAMFIDFLSGKNRDLFLLNNGAATLRQYDTGGELHIPASHWEFLSGLPLYHRCEDFIFVHAGLRPGVPLERQQEQDLLWIRGDFLYSDYDWGGVVVFGHTPLDRVLQDGNKLGLDTGAVYGRLLTACEVRQRTFWSVRGPKPEGDKTR
ncbi:MAG: serine/threonine protein phosphatase [Deltaproteobacteria bacterium]|nr:serine/threonine protein phosphatase [Deltaproteobacteria bacterium]